MAYRRRLAARSNTRLRRSRMGRLPRLSRGASYDIRLAKQGVDVKNMMYTTYLTSTVGTGVY